VILDRRAGDGQGFTAVPGLLPKAEPNASRELPDSETFASARLFAAGITESRLISSENPDRKRLLAGNDPLPSYRLPHWLFERWFCLNFICVGSNIINLGHRHCWPWVWFCRSVCGSVLERRVAAAIPQRPWSEGRATTSAANAALMRSSPRRSARMPRPKRSASGFEGPPGLMPFGWRANSARLKTYARSQSSRRWLDLDSEAARSR